MTSCAPSSRSAPPNEDVLGLPDMALMLSDVLVVFDHLKHTVTVLAHVHVGDDLPREYAEAQAAIAEVCGALAGPVPAAAPRSAPRAEPVFESNMSRETFEAMVSRIIEYIYAGDAFQVVPSQRWSAPIEQDAFSIYRGLRDGQPEPVHVLPGLR